MINLLIADDNIYYAKSLVNFISNRDNQIRFINISTDGKEALDNIISKPVDVVLLDLKMPNLSGIDILNILNKKQIDKKISIIVISEEINLISKIKNNSLVVSCINKSQGMEYIFKEIQNVILDRNLEDSGKKIKNEILNELLYLGYNIKHKGTQYLLEIIYIVCQLKEYSVINNIEKCLYSRIANKYCKTTQNIKSNIIKATDCMYIESNNDRIKYYFNFLHNYKPTPKVVIATIASKIDSKL